MFEQPFAHGHSFIHRIDPRVRVAAALACSIALALLRHWQSACLGLALSAILFGLSQPLLRPALKRLAIVNIFLLFLWLFVPLTTGGEAAWQWGPLEISAQGLRLAFLVTLKANAMALLCIALICSMDAATFGQALECLGCPRKLVFLLLFSWRYAGTAAGEWGRLAAAARLRGFIPRTNPHTYRTFGALFGMTFVRGFDRSARVHEAMLLRGFSGRFLSMAVFRTRIPDAAFAALALAFLAALILFDVRVGYACV